MELVRGVFAVPGEWRFGCGFDPLLPAMASGGVERRVSWGYGFLVTWRGSCGGLRKWGLSLTRHLACVQRSRVACYYLAFGLASRRLIGVAVTLLLLSSCGVLPESSFELAPSSRLPRWIQLSAGQRRDQVRVTLDYYISPFGRTCTFSLYDDQTRRLRKVSGSIREQHPLTLKNSSPRFAAGYPSYEVITIEGSIDVVEHRAMEPVFYMTDDRVVREVLGVPSNPPLEPP
jgi:hypothetical protein